LTGLNLGEVEHVVNQAKEVFAVGLEAIEHLAHLVRRLAVERALRVMAGQSVYATELTNNGPAIHQAPQTYFGIGATDDCGALLVSLFERSLRPVF
jgi:hypothetical protein